MTETKLVTIDEIRAVLDKLRNGDGSISAYIKLRHMLSENISRNLYNNAM